MNIINEAAMAIMISIAGEYAVDNNLKINQDELWCLANNISISKPEQNHTQANRQWQMSQTTEKIQNYILTHIVKLSRKDRTENHGRQHKIKHLTNQKEYTIPESTDVNSLGIVMERKIPYGCST